MSRTHGPGCPHPQDRCTCEVPDEMIEVPRPLLKALLACADCADFGYEATFDNVAAMRTLAEQLDEDPWDWTPYQFLTDFCPGHQWTEWRKGGVLYGTQLHSFLFRNCQICKTHERAELGEPEA